MNWVPFFQSLLWVIVIGILLLILRKWIVQFLNTFIKRMERGDPTKVGPVEVGESHPQDSYSPKDLLMVKAEKESPKTDKFSFGAYPEMPEAVRKARVVKLIHKIGQWGEDRDGYTRRDVVVTLDTNPDTLLDNIAKVTYYLPASWPEELRIQEKSDRSNNFTLKTRTYGEVTVGAVVEFNDGTDQLILNRYCNFYDQ